MSLAGQLLEAARNEPDPQAAAVLRQEAQVMAQLACAVQLDEIRDRLIWIHDVLANRGT